MGHRETFDGGRFAPTVAMPPAPPSLQGVCVLVVEDNPDLLDLTVNVLRRCGAKVSGASTAERGLRMATEGWPHVVVTDIGLPDQDGYWLADQLTVMGLSAVPVIAFTAQCPDSRASLHRFRRWVMKPLQPAVLCDVVAEVVRHSMLRSHNPNRPAASA